MPELDGRPEDYGVPAPGIPAALPTGVAAEQLYLLLDRLAGMEDDLQRLTVVREELRALRKLTVALAGWRSFYCTRLWLAEVPTRVIAKAAGVADSYVSKRAKRFGLPPRRVDKRRDG